MEINEERLKEVIKAHEHPEDWPYGEEVACLDEKEELALCVELLKLRQWKASQTQALGEVANRHKLSKAERSMYDCEG